MKFNLEVEIDEEELVGNSIKYHFDNMKDDNRRIRRMKNPPDYEVQNLADNLEAMKHLKKVYHFYTAKELR